MDQSIQRPKKRIAILLFGALILLSILILRVTYIQIFMAGRLKEGAEEQRFRAVSILPGRGTIYDRFGDELAISVDADCVFAVPKEVGMVEILLKKGRKVFVVKRDYRQKTKVAAMLGSILGIDSDRLRLLFTKQTSFVWIKRKATFGEIEKLRKILRVQNIRGIEISQSPQRFYPRKNLAAQVLGIAGIDNQGLEGLEKELDLYLRGTPGSDRAEFDTLGQHIPQGERRYQPPREGDSVYLTIDQNIQYILERELEKAVTDTNSKRGMGIIINPATGEILALSAYPTFDPNKFNEFPSANRRNPLFSDMYEPGSTFKIFTAATALEEGKVSPESSFYDPGYIIVDDRRLKCWKAGGHGNENFVEALENSCNPVFAALALRLTKERFYDYIKAFGFGSLTEVDFPGESAGMLKPLSMVRNVELANIGFGQGITVTPIQMVMGAAAIANGGYLLKPRLVKEIRSVDGKVIKTFRREIVRQVLSTKTSALMCRLLESVVTNGSGNKAYLSGYRIAGKTGTAQKVQAGRRGYSQLIASFVGFAPADNPRLLAMIILDEPGSPIKYGGVIAAPVVGNIFRDSLRYLGVRPEYDAAALEKLNEAAVTVPNISGLSIEKATRTLKGIGLDFRIIGAGNLVYDQTPKSGAKVGRGVKVILYLNPAAKYNRENTKVLLPDLRGLSLAKSSQILGELGIGLEARGTGVLVNQSPPAGVMVELGSTVKATFKNVADENY